MIEHYASNYGYSIGIEFLNEKEDNFFFQSAIFFFTQEHVKARYAEIYLNFPVHLGKCKQSIRGALFRVKGNKFALILLC